MSTQSEVPNRVSQEDIGTTTRQMNKMPNDSAFITPDGMFTQQTKRKVKLVKNGLPTPYLRQKRLEPSCRDRKGTDRKGTTETPRIWGVSDGGWSTVGTGRPPGEGLEHARSVHCGEDTTATSGVEGSVSCDTGSSQSSLGPVGQEVGVVYLGRLSGSPVPSSKSLLSL